MIHCQAPVSGRRAGWGGYVVAGGGGMIMRLIVWGTMLRYVCFAATLDSLLFPCFLGV